MSKTGRAALSLAAAAVVLVVMAWFDTTVVRDAKQQFEQTVDPSQFTLVVSLGMIAIPGAVLLLTLLAWRSESAVVGVIYAVVGAFFAFLLWISSSPAMGRNGGAPLLPESLVTALGNIFEASVGQLNAVGIVGGGMLIAGVAVIARSIRAWRAAASTAPQPNPTSQPVGP